MTAPGSSPLPRLTIATDGSCLSNPGGAGGWAWVVSEAEWAAGANPSTTNQRMELQAIGQAVRDFPDRALLIQSDSLYSIKCLTEWLPGWIKRGWKNSAKQDVANQDLIKYIAQLLVGRDVEFEHVRGHRGHVLNELADLKCGAAAAALRAGQPIEVGPGRLVTTAERSGDA